MIIFELLLKLAPFFETAGAVFCNDFSMSTVKKQVYLAKSQMKNINLNICWALTLSSYCTTQTRMWKSFLNNKGILSQTLWYFPSNNNSTWLKKTRKNIMHLKSLSVHFSLWCIIWPKYKLSIWVTKNKMVYCKKLF